MEETASVKGQLLIRSIIEEYRNLLEVLADPQLLLTDSNNSKHLDPTDAHDSKKTTQEILQKLTRLFSQLKSVYNQCLEEIKRLDGSKVYLFNLSLLIIVSEKCFFLAEASRSIIRASTEYAFALSSSPATSWKWCSESAPRSQPGLRFR